MNPQTKTTTTVIIEWVISGVTVFSGIERPYTCREGRAELVYTPRREDK